MDLQGWIAKYEAKTGEKFIRKEGFSLLFFPDKGFAEIDIDNDLGAVLVHRVCGDLQAWRMVIESVMQLCGFHRITAIIIRHIKPFIRLWGAKVTKEYSTEFGMAYEVEFTNGKGLCYPAAIIGGNIQYLVALEVGV